MNASPEISAALHRELIRLRNAGKPELAARLKRLSASDPRAALREALATDPRAGSPATDSDADADRPETALDLLSLAEIREILGSGKITDPAQKWRLAERARELRGHHDLFQPEQ